MYDSRQVAASGLQAKCMYDSRQVAALGLQARCMYDSRQVAASGLQAKCMYDNRQVTASGLQAKWMYTAGRSRFRDYRQSGCTTTGRSRLWNYRHDGWHDCRQATDIGLTGIVVMRWPPAPASVLQRDCGCAAVAQSWLKDHWNRAYSITGQPQKRASHRRWERRIGTGIENRYRKRCRAWREAVFSSKEQENTI